MYTDESASPHHSPVHALDDAALARRHDLTAFIAQGEKPGPSGMLGIELEHCIVRKITHAPVSYFDEGGTAQILAAMGEHYDSPIYEGESLIGFSCDDYTVTIEPAGQIEISIAPRESLSEIAAIYNEFRDILDEALDEYDAEALETGYHPTACALDLPLIPKERYRIMDTRFRDTGSHGPNMMRGTQSTQVSIDYSSEADMRLKYRLAALLGPLVYFLCDNSPIFEGDVASGRMVRTRIWDDVDPERCGLPKGMFSQTGHAEDGGWGYEDYANWVLSSRPLLVMEGDETVNTGLETADEHYGSNSISDDECAHLLSMFFPDVRLKRYVEIRMADSMPIKYALSYAAFIKGIFYNDESLLEACRIFGLADEHGILAKPLYIEEDVAAAKAALERDSYLASVYGMQAWSLLDELFSIAWQGLPRDERAWLEPLAHLEERRTTLLDEAFAPDEDITMASLEDEWIQTAKDLGGDASGIASAYEYMQHSTGIYHGNPVAFGYVPRLMPPLYMRAFDKIVQTTHSILAKVTKAYREDESIRKLFAFSPDLERLCMIDPGYDQLIPISRFDIFLDERAGIGSDGDLSFMFCEFNTDGTSAMNEDREVANSLLGTQTFAKMADRYDIVPQTLFDPWVRSFMSVYSQFEGALDRPNVAIVDFEENGTSYEFEKFCKRFEAHGIPCRSVDILDLVFENGRLSTKDGWNIDCVYRRVVTSDVMARFSEASALTQAAASGKVCIIGNFDTSIAASKNIFRALLLPEVLDMLDEDEAEFVQQHVPYTALLGTDDIDLDEVRLEKDRWLIKPNNGYGSEGAFAGRDWSEDEWSALIDEHLHDDYVIQRWCDQYASGNLLTSPSQMARAVSGGTVDEDRFVQLNNMIGIFDYDGRLAGFYTRAGDHSIISGPFGGQTLASMIVHEKRSIN